MRTLVIASVFLSNIALAHPGGHHHHHQNMPYEPPIRIYPEEGIDYTHGCGGCGCQQGPSQQQLDQEYLDYLAAQHRLSRLPLDHDPVVCPVCRANHNRQNVRPNSGDSQLHQDETRYHQMSEEKETEEEETADPILVQYSHEVPAGQARHHQGHNHGHQGQGYSQHGHQGHQRQNHHEYLRHHDQRLDVPSGAYGHRPVHQPVQRYSRRRSDCPGHLVREGETLFSIARYYRMSVTQLMNINQLRDDYIQMGECLYTR